MSKRPLRVKELAEFFAIQPDVDTTPTFDARFRPENPEEFILSACSTLVAVVGNRGKKIVQFSHFSVKEYLTSDRIAISEHVSRFHVLPRLAHALVARACLSVLLQLDVLLDDHNIRNQILSFPLASYAARYWVNHAQFDDIASEIQHGMECLFDKDKPHLAAWLQIYDIDKQYRYSFISMIEYRLSIFPFPVPLYYAALCGFRRLAEHLVDTHPQDVNARGGRHVTPLHAALDMGHLNVAMLLLARGADIESPGSWGRTPLHLATYHGYADVVSLLVDRGVNPNGGIYDWETPLYLASKYGRRDVTRLLLKHGAKPNYQEFGGLTPLRAAWREGHIDNVRLLLDYGADANSPDDRGKSPLHVVLQEDSDIDILLLDPPYHIMDSLKPNPAFFEHRLDVVMLLLEHGADANYPDNHGRTPIHIALRRGFIDVAQLLLHHGADANHPDKHGRTPLHLALQRRLIGIVRLLLDHGADASYPDKRGLTPRHIGLYTGNDEIILLLFNLPGNDGWTRLHAASQEGHDDIVRLLLDHGADANRSDNDGWSSLHAASQEGHDTVVRLLLDHGADVKRSDNDGWSPLHAASQGGHDTIVRLLLERGAAADHPDRDGWTPLHAASQEGHDHLVQLLLDHGAAPNLRDKRSRTPLVEE